ncbi:hypothetical protein K8O93_00745 [Gordonia bronchialis]|uniref:hypothetical protein n=1 Tax=Gordonia bronchialis TaxID=2054 RepID=UPI001CBBBBB7|nr:hypothetical protein [Gordonia bronchialis]UAK38361.1 hypothetical protein K8O93_00745 [Gordonia bronchialis]
MGWVQSLRADGSVLVRNREPVTLFKSQTDAESYIKARIGGEPHATSVGRMHALVLEDLTIVEAWDVEEDRSVLLFKVGDLYLTGLSGTVKVYQRSDIDIVRTYEAQEAV